MDMRRYMTSALVAVMLLAVMSCSLVDRFTGGADMKPVAQLWPDVPAMDGLTRTEEDMPIGTKLILRTIIGNLGLMNKDGEDRSTGDIDWTWYSGNKTVADVQAFYSADKMASAGNWEKGKNAPCIDGKEKGVDGTICVFQKKVGDRSAGLIIMAMTDDKTKKTDVYYLRIEGDTSSKGAKTK